MSIFLGGKKRRTFKKKGGCGTPPLSPAPYEGVGTLASPSQDANYAGRPTFSTTQVGGDIGYGYADGKDAGVYGGSYFPVTRACMSGMDPSRGGNNFMSGGRRRRSRSKRSSGKRSSGKRSKKSGGKRTRSKKSGGRKSKRTRSKRRGGKKWSQKGCSKMKGGFFFV
jgi:hypothetical protein